MITKSSGTTIIPTKFGDFKITAFQHDRTHGEHALIYVDKVQIEVPLVRIHSECLTGDIFSSRRCDCGEQLSKAMARIAEEGEGYILYLRQEGRGIGLLNKLKAYQLQDQGLDTVEANRSLGFQDDQRNYEVAIDILNTINLKKFRLLSNNPRKFEALTTAGFNVTREPLICSSVKTNKAYLTTKQIRLGHML